MATINKPFPIKPPRLRQGATIAVVAPAGTVESSQIEKGINRLMSLGYVVQPGSYLYTKRGYLAGNDTQRLEDLNRAINDPLVNAIFCARGGYGSMRLLRGIDYENISKRPKALVGFSDITALLMALFHRAGVVSFHGPMVKNFAEGHYKGLQKLLEMLTDGKPWEMNLDQCEAISPGRTVGVIMGGNLSIIVSLIGTPYLPSLEGSILFIEDTDEPLYRIDRMLTSLKLRGSLGGVNGIVAGEFHSCGGREEIRELLFHITKDLNIPVVEGAPFGHGIDNFPFPVGIEAILDTNKGAVYSLEPPVL